MGSGAWVNRGFWLFLGMTTGMLIYDLTNVRTAEAVATSQYKEYLMATGRSNQANIEFVWLLDYKGARLLFISLGQSGALGGISEVDLMSEFKLGAGGETPHFMMVTGLFQTRNIADILYVAETGSGQMLIVGVPPNIMPNGAPATPPQVVARFDFAQK